MALAFFNANALTNVVALYIILKTISLINFTLIQSILNHNLLIKKKKKKEEESQPSSFS